MSFLSYETLDTVRNSPGVIEFLGQFDQKVYCDIADNRLPNPPSPKTADLLKGEIKKSKRLVILYSPQSATSKWIPWELPASFMTP